MSDEKDRRIEELVGVESKLRELLWDMVNSHAPTWHYSMEKTGYQCAHCGCLHRTRSEASAPYGHKEDCAWAKSVIFLHHAKVFVIDEVKLD